MKGNLKYIDEFLYVSVAKRRLAFLNKEGFDRFGYNLLFAPLIKWETLKERVIVIKNHATEYEDAYNGMKTSIQLQNDLKTIFNALPKSTLVLVNKEIERQTEGRRIAVSEKGAYVQARSLLCLFVLANTFRCLRLIAKPWLYKKH